MSVHVQGCRVTDNHPVFVDNKWQLPGHLGRVVQRFGKVYGVELEGWLLSCLFLLFFYVMSSIIFYFILTITL